MNLTVLLIADNPQDIDLVSRCLHKGLEQIELIHKRTCEDGLQELQKNTAIDFVLVDIRLPDSKGIEELEHFPRTFSSTPMIVLTGEDRDEYVEVANRYGFEDYLVKEDLSPNLMKRAIRYAIERKRSKIQNDFFQAKIEQSRVQAVQQAKMASLGLMAAGIAHEINNPLAIIEALASKLEKLSQLGKLEAGDLEASLQKMRKTILRIAEIIEGLRRYSRDDSKEVFERVQISSIVKDTMSLCRERFKQKGIIVKEGEIDESIWVDGRSIEISQVLINLLNNAYQAIETAQDKWIEVKVEADDDRVVLVVGDSGTGIAKEDAEKIFHPFYTTRPIGQGTGLGLSISKGIIEAHGGSMHVDVVAENTKLCVTLPRSHSGQKRLAV